MQISGSCTSNTPSMAQQLQADQASHRGRSIAEENKEQAIQQGNSTQQPDNETSAANKTQAPQAGQQAANLDPAEKQQVQELQVRDREVRAHEAAHKAAAGQHATGGATYTYQRGPDGRLYAVGGEVGIDTSPVPDDPQATLQKANQIRAAAMAPAQPSSQDVAVAAKAAMMAAEARAAIFEERQAEATESREEAGLSDTETEKEPAGTTDNHDSGVQQYQQVASSAGETPKPQLDLHA